MAKLNKKLTLYGLTMIAIGACIGSGIFATPNAVVAQVPHAGLALLVWAIGGLIALTGALTFAELGGMFPRSGGVYVYIKKAYGDLAGFLYGWVILLVINTGALAALSVVFADYMQFFVPGITGQHKTLLSILTIAVLTLLNVRGIGMSQLFANTFTGLKLLALLGIIVAGFVAYNPEGVELNIIEPTGYLPDNMVSAMLVALVGVLWSFGGWHHASYLAGETKNAQKTVPRAMIIGTVVVTAVYLLANIAYMMILPLDELAASKAVAGDALNAISPIGGMLAAVIIAISIFGTIGIYTMSAPRIYFAMAKDGVFFSSLARIHPKWSTPANAMIAQAVWAIILLLLWQTFADLISYVTFMDIAFMALAGFSVFIFRKRMPNVPRPYRVLGYPVVPAIFVLISTAFVINTLIELRFQAGTGLLVLGIGVLFYRQFKERNAPYLQEWTEGDYLVSTNAEKVNLDVIYHFLRQSYWAENIPRTTVERSVKEALCFGVYRNDEMVGFARCITDMATFVYVADVFILPDYRKQGLSKFLMRCIKAHPDLQGVRRWHLVTKDAQGLYEKFGFEPLENPERHMQINQKNPY